MNIDQIIFLTASAGTTGCAAYFLCKLLLSQRDEKLYGRLQANTKGVDDDGQPRQRQGIGKIIGSLGQLAASPFMPKTREKQSGLTRQLRMAGIYTPSAIRAVVGFKLILLIGGISVGLIAGSMINYLFLCAAVGGLIGYLMPTMWLKGKISANQKMLQLGLPDALDLMVVCVEAGLTVDAAMQRVGEELAISHPVVSREFGIAHMETRIGLPRAEALKNMGIRTGNPPLQQLIAMLVQAERFGTSIANALRIQSETLRVKRQHVAEEMAAKASVKMSFPLVLFIFPATFIVLAGPTVIGLFNSDIMK